MAQAPPAPSQSVPPSLRDKIIVTASALPETVEQTPASVSVITKEEIDDRAALDVADVLREIPGITISRSGSSGKATSLFSRGASSTQTLVLWNGIEINNPYFAGYDWGRFSTVGVEQIEIVRGPYSALYGSDAVAGVVNVITTPLRSALGGSFVRGGHGLRNAAVDGSLLGGNGILSGSFERRADDGWSANDDFSQDSAMLGARWGSSPRFTLGLTGRYTRYDLGIPMNLNAAGTALVPSLERRQSGNERQIAVPVSAAIGRVAVEVTAAESRRDDDFSDPEDPFGTTSQSTESVTRHARLSLRSATPIGTLVGGGEYERAVVDDTTNFGPNLSRARRSDRSLFIEDRVSHSLGQAISLELSAGARYDDFDTFGSQTSPRAAIALTAGRNKLRAAYGQGFRAPSIGELFFPFLGNRNLHAEHSRSAEVGYDRKFGESGTLSLTLFDSRYRDLIVFDNLASSFANIGRATSRGLEAGARARLTEATYGGFSYTYLRTSGDGERLLRRPPHSGSVYVGYRSGGEDVNVTLVHTGVRDDLSPVFPFGRLSDRAYTTIDATLRLTGRSVIPLLKVENATGARYEEVRGFPSPGRRVILGVELKVQ
jgi:vitamin B12 transporter